jgi:hypothetical protein
MDEKKDTFPLEETSPNDGRGVFPDDIPVAELQKSFWSRLWPVFACGAGLFSDGYLQSV